MTARFEAEKLALGRDWTDYTVLPLESHWICNVMAPDESGVSSTLTFTTNAMQQLVATFLENENENVIYCLPISSETAIEIAGLS
jgi:hypothetical protein